MILENELLQLALGMAQAVLLLLCAPLVTGIVKKVKAWMQNRIGSSIWQEYYDIRKWWGKPTMLTPYTSITFRLAPCVYFLTTFAAACMLPGFLGGQAGFGDVFVFVYLLALGRFFMAVSSMDAATAFGGMGGSREVYVAAFVEPVVMLAVLSNVLHTNSTSLAGMSLRTDEVNLTVAGVLTCIAFFLVLLAENSRIPVDNPDTHLELTMIHECADVRVGGDGLHQLVQIGQHFGIQGVQRLGPVDGRHGVEALLLQQDIGHIYSSLRFLSAGGDGRAPSGPHKRQYSRPPQRDGRIYSSSYI